MPPKTNRKGETKQKTLPKSLREKKPVGPPLTFFSAQFKALLVGPDKEFPSFDDLCRYAHGEYGYNGVSLDTGMLDIRRINSDVEYRESFVAHYKELGTPICKLANHVVGQRVCMHPAVLPRFVGFAPSAYRHLGLEAIEEQAADQMIDEILAAHHLGVNIHTFCGGKTVPVLADPWNAYPQELREKALAILAIKWEHILAFAGNMGVKVGFETRHIMEDLVVVNDLIDFRDTFLLSDSAKKAVDWGLDFSHYEIDGDDPVHDANLAFNAGMCNMNHFKQGYFDTFPGHCRRPANMAWKDRAGKFCTYGIKNPHHAKALMDIVLQVHNREPHGTHIDVEGECMYLRNPLQSMEVAANNVRRIMSGVSPISLEELEIRAWDGPAFDKFADSGYTAEAGMALNTQEVRALEERLETVRPLLSR